MIIEYNDENIKVSSYVQTWGSIPLVWSQEPDLKWEPKIKISSDSTLNEKVAKLHLTEQVNKYKDVICVNLIDKKKQQGMIGNAFTEIVKKVANPKVTYVWFDFHHECWKMQYDNIGKLIEEVKSKFDSYDYFMA